MKRLALVLVAIVAFAATAHARNLPPESHHGIPQIFQGRWCLAYNIGDGKMLYQPPKNDDAWRDCRERGNAIDITANGYSNADDWLCTLTLVVNDIHQVQWAEFIGKFKCGQGIVAGDDKSSEIDIFELGDKSDLLTVTTKGKKQ
jgi:hypothetical protein